MFGLGDPEDLKDQIEQQRKRFDALEQDFRARIDRLAGVLGDAYLVVEQGADRFDWEDTQREYYARGMESVVMGQAKRSRDACAKVRDLVKAELGYLGLKPSDVGTAARVRREAEAKRARAAELRAEAERLEREAASS
jgi:hypothetical protein